MVLLTGKTTVPKSAPGVYASKEVLDGSITADGIAILTLAERDSKGDTRGQPEFWAKCEAGKLVITCEEDQLKNDTDIYYFIDSDGTGISGGGGGIDYYDIWGDGTLGLCLHLAEASVMIPGIEELKVSAADFIKAVYGGVEPFNYSISTTSGAFPPVMNTDPKLAIATIPCAWVGPIDIIIQVEDSSTPLPQMIWVETVLQNQDNMGACP